MCGVFAHLINETSKGLLCFIVRGWVGLGGLALGLASDGDLGLAVFKLGIESANRCVPCKEDSDHDRQESEALNNRGVQFSGWGYNDTRYQESRTN